MISILEDIGACSLWEFKDGKQFSQVHFADVWTFIKERESVGKAILKVRGCLQAMNPKEALEILETHEKKFDALTFGHYKDSFEKIKVDLNTLVQVKELEAFVEEEQGEEKQSDKLTKKILSELRPLYIAFSKDTSSLSDQAIALDSILTKMKVGDLIPQNFIFSRVGEELLLIPIDLEVILASKTSMGVPLGKHMKINEKEVSFLEEFQLAVKEYPVRILPLATESMISPAIHSAYNSREMLSDHIMKSLEQDYTLSISKSDLQKYILIDLINKDVPYCTLFQGELFYGPPNKGIRIGRLKNQ